ncbi:uncharacterized protein N7503_007416 [Penicillium pulvis]|uniref:uncharacterized protein n=1 Tax=Penicillium pulvis TaxID=1562058 RepID=UPI002546D259|nr:uncharacterized protein N7503_007416 [Penicillium pulvis]KAJ5798120.1 hypothetical protein N7503_007416 [Penicillium pulvis]
MPTTDFRMDLRDASTPQRFTHLSRVQPGDYDGSISFDFHDSDSGTNIEFQVVVSDPSDYPTDHSFVVFASSDNVAPQITTGLEKAQDKGTFTGVSIHDVLTTVDCMVHNALRDPKPQSPGGPDYDDDSDGSDGIIDEYEEFSDDATFNLPSRQMLTLALPQKLRYDLRLAKAAGFKVGCLGDVTGPIILSIARRISKLDISEEAMQAWTVEPSEYLVLLIQYSNGYQDMQGIFDMKESAAPWVRMRIGLCDSYKPSSFQAALLAFQAPPTSSITEVDNKPPDTKSMASLRPVFIGSSLNKLLNERLLGIITARKKLNLSWTGAEFFVHANQGKVISAEDADNPQFYIQDTWVSPPSSALVSDHYQDMGLDMTRTSFPLVAMQFTLRHFIRCAEFCLICHCKTFDGFEVLKPYVCSNGLCLYQYITFGMGSSVEHDIRTQPFVVDLLVSLAYARAKTGLLEDFPTGLGILVPDEEKVTSGKKGAKLSEPPSYHTGRLIKSSMTVFCQAAGITAGDWIQVIHSTHSLTASWHCQVQDVDEGLAFITLSQPIPTASQVLLHSTLPEAQDVSFVCYDQKFDNMKPQKKQAVMLKILDTLPSIQLMELFLGSSDSEKVLSSWRERITPAALDMLRWIVASNRSCILQDHNDRNHLVSNMPGYMQFRLVQGAPDKEQRFINAIESVAMTKNPSNPTLFAWHGSPIANWHSILRKGLNFDKISNGRACGNGVYFSRHFTTSVGYTNNLTFHHQTGDRVVSEWPHSRLKMQSVLSLNEIINRPTDFVSQSPHFVVDHLDWIQPRYLFVGNRGSVGPNLPTVQTSDFVPFYSQDPKYPAIGSNGKSVRIPLSAVSSQRRQIFGTRSPVSSLNSPARIRKESSETATSSESTDTNTSKINNDDCASVSTATDDLNLLISDSGTEDGITGATVDTEIAVETKTIEEIPSERNLQMATPPTHTALETDFVSGTLQANRLPIIAPPRYATTTATKLLQQHLQTTLKVQKKEAPAELGWCLDPNLISTVYQWIVELHSFDSALPLAQDLKAAKLNSVVLELRFPNDFPMNPPFVRVIRPRFLEFAAGGGGHVTAGGAICMELLSNSGWSPVTSIESVLLQVRLALSTTEPRPARLARCSRRDYGIGEAVAAFRRACLSHGWRVPNDLELITG